MGDGLSKRRETGRRYARIVFGLLSVGLLALAIVAVASQVWLLKIGVRTTGVIASGPFTHGEPDIYEIRFETPLGSEVRFHQEVTMYQGLPMSSVPVVYDPNEPRHARIATRSALWTEPITLAALALVSAGVAAVMRRRE